MKIPEQFDARFLDWFRERTEAAWSTYQTPTLEDYIAKGSRGGGCNWRQGTRWLGGLTDERIASAEQRWALRFPPDYGLFLQRLHTVDRPRFCVRFTDPDRDGGASHLVARDGPSFYNWLTDDEAIQGQLDWLVEGLRFDVEHAGLWRSGWGPKPAALAEQRERVRELVTAAPRLIPVFGHRYLLAEPCQAGNPVLSIYQSDIIVYGPDLRTYLLAEFADILGTDRDEAKHAAVDWRRREVPYQYATIPFWGDLLYV